jgi:hypothetical protein
VADTSRDRQAWVEVHILEDLDQRDIRKAETSLITTKVTVLQAQAVHPDILVATEAPTVALGYV